MKNLNQLNAKPADMEERSVAVIADHYIRLDLTYDEALADPKELRERNQPGVAIVTNETAIRLSNGEILSLKAA